MSAWVEQIHRRAALVHDQIAAALKIAPQTGLAARELIGPYQALLDRLYLDELPYARLLDYSDLVINAQGPATQTHEPRVSALTSLLDRLRDESRRLAKAVGGIRDDQRVDHLDLLLSGLARGSLVVGLRLALPPSDPRQLSFITEDEPVFQAVRTAIKALSSIPRLLTDTGVSDEIRDVLPDPAVRDAALVMAQRLSPSGRSGIDTIEVSAPGSDSGVFTVEGRTVLRQVVARPLMRRSARGTFRGTVRELDLDARRIEVRHVPNVGTIRCVIEALDVVQARRWLNKLVSVRGQYEEDADGRPRLLRADKVSVLKTPRQLRLPSPKRGAG